MSQTPRMLCILAGLTFFGTARAQDVQTSFEFLDTSLAFTLGTTPNRVTFLGGIAGTTFDPALHRTGGGAWIFAPATSGEIRFETAAERIDLWFRDLSPTQHSLVEVLDTADQVVLSVSGTTAFQNVQVTVGAGSLPIERVRIENASTAGITVADDFAYTADTNANGRLNDPLPAPLSRSTITVALEPVTTGLIAPNWATFAVETGNGPAGPGNHVFVTDQVGTLWAIDVRTGTRVAMLDVNAQLVNLGIRGPGSFDERGLLGVALHPDYLANGLLYTYQSEPVNGPADFSTMPMGVPANHQAVIAEWRVPNPTRLPSASDPSTRVDPSSKRVLLRIDQPQFNHNAGCLNFGPDGRLYVALGDGGAADDQGTGHSPGGNGQDPSNVLGALLRIDPRGTNATNGQYGIPGDNPFVGRAGFVPEIWAYGFRNPFRFSFDTGSRFHAGTGELWLGDVGQNHIEEVAIVRAGENHGWPFLEGSFAFDPNGTQRGFVTLNPPQPIPPGLTRPVAEYDHDEGISVIGGFVYRGIAVPELNGLYVFGEFARTFRNDGRLFVLDARREIRELRIEGQTGVDRSLLGIGRDRVGELYLLTNETGFPFPDPSGRATGAVFRITSPAGGSYQDLGFGHAGLGTPRLQGHGSLRLSGSRNALELRGSAPLAPTILFLGVQRIDFPILGGTLVPTPDALGGFLTDAGGRAFFVFDVAPGLPAGITAYAQMWMADAGTPSGVASSNALAITLGF